MDLIRVVWYRVAVDGEFKRLTVDSSGVDAFLGCVNNMFVYNQASEGLDLPYVNKH